MYLMSRSSDKNYEIWKLGTGFQLFSTLLWNSRKREEKGHKSPLAWWNRRFGDWQEQSIQAFVGKWSLSILLALPVCPKGHCKVGWMGLPRAREPFPSAYRGFALCHAILPPRASNTHQLWWLRKGLQLSCRIWGQLQSWVVCSRQVSKDCLAHRLGTSVCKNCNHLGESSTKCTNSVPWLLPRLSFTGVTICPMSITKINLALHSWLKSSPATPRTSCRRCVEEEGVGGACSPAFTCPLNFLEIWAREGSEWCILKRGPKAKWGAGKDVQI